MPRAGGKKYLGQPGREWHYLPFTTKVCDMAHLLILRHGKTERVSPSGADRDRRLTERGIKNSAAMGRYISAHMKKPGLVLVSPAERAQATAEHLTAQLGDAETVFDERIYGGDGETLLDVLKDHAQGAETVLLVGHNPGLIILVHMLIGDVRDGDFGDLHHFPTCALAEISFDVPTIGGIEYQSGTLRALLRPSEMVK
jgi:phosphohistidine phosphatase